jgi:hypothetical protein
MISTINNGTYTFNARGKEIEVFISHDGHVEMYEGAKPSTTGFYFEDIKGLTFLCNSLEDILEHYEATHGKCE